MRPTTLFVPTLLVLAGALCAQAKPTFDYYAEGQLREAVGIDALGSYYLHNTGWPVHFTRQVIPDSWLGQPLLLQARNDGTSLEPKVAVSFAALTDKMLDFTKFATGQKTLGWVTAHDGAFVTVSLDVQEHVRWTTMPGAGVWTLCPDPCGFAQGYVTAGDGAFRFAFEVPADDSLIGLAFTGQAIVTDPAMPAGIRLSNPETRTVVAGM